MTARFDAAALGSDLPRSRQQYLARKLARAAVSILRLNRTGLFATEMAQATMPIATVETKYGPLYCRAGHGRLVWRAASFFEEEPETIAWLDRIEATDVFWDIGANVGLYALYAAKFRHCRTIAFEPEAQNQALLVENIALNEIADRCLPVAIALDRDFTLGRLMVRYVTKGGAFNHFQSDRDDDALPKSFAAAQGYEHHEGLEQAIFSSSIDDLVYKYELPPPTHLKIDVDGLEPRIIDGARRTLSEGSLKGILIELNAKSEADMAVPSLLESHGFHCRSERSNWLSRPHSPRAADLPASNMIFERP